MSADSVRTKKEEERGGETTCDDLHIQLCFRKKKKNEEEGGRRKRKKYTHRRWAVRSQLIGLIGGNGMNAGVRCSKEREEREERKPSYYYSALFRLI